MGAAVAVETVAVEDLDLHINPLDFRSNRNRCDTGLIPFFPVLGTNDYFVTMVTE